MSDNINFDYKNLSPFKWFVLENFPFIEADFDALTDWQLFCKLGKEINKIIDSQNIVGEQAETLTNTFNTLYNYVHNYFDNLDVQDEIDNKLNELVESGELQLVSLSKKSIFLGDSYNVGTTVTTNPMTIDGWGVRVKNLMNLKDNEGYVLSSGGSGFITKGAYGQTFLSLLQNNSDLISNKNEIKNIIVCGGYNDGTKEITQSQIENAIKNFITYCNTNFPNAQVYIGFIGNDTHKTPEGYGKRYFLRTKTLPAYHNCNKYGAVYLNGVENIMKNYNLMSNDLIHPNENGYDELSKGIFNSIITGNYDYIASYTYDLDLNFLGSSIKKLTLNINQYGNITTISNINTVLPFETPISLNYKYDLGYQITVDDKFPSYDVKLAYQKQGSSTFHFLNGIVRKSSGQTYLDLYVPNYVNPEENVTTLVVLPNSWSINTQDLA